jgi:SRSO17 transposase
MQIRTIINKKFTMEVWPDLFHRLILVGMCGTKGRLSARFAAMRVRVADGPPQRIRNMGGQRMAGEEVWLIGEYRKNDERKYYLDNLPAKTARKTFTASIKARWICEQAHQQLK